MNVTPLPSALTPCSPALAPHRVARARVSVSQLLIALSALSVGLIGCGDPSSTEPPPLDQGTGGVGIGGAQIGGVTGFSDLGPDASTGGEGGAGVEVTLNDELLCQSCDVSDASSCAEGYVCHQPPANAEGEQEPAFCTRPCDVSACPSAYECVSPSEQLSSSEGGTTAGAEGGTTASAEGGTTAGVSAGGSEPRLCLPVAKSCSPVFCNDQDGDGYGRGRDCLGLDCDDSNPNVNPGVELDLCDGVDNNCNAEIDEGFVSASCGEGACSGVTVCEMGAERCDAPGASGSDEDCDGLDNDCDGAIDEGYVPVSCGQGVCQALSRCVMGQVSCEPTTPPAGELDASCDLIDNDCDGVVDEGFVGASCGVGACSQPATCTAQGISCTPLQATGNDSDCDLIDDDCDGRVDEGFLSATSCGLGVCRRPESCVEGEVLCSEGNPQSATDATCDGVDDNCNGLIDEGCAENALSFELVLNEPSAITVAVRLSRGMEMGAPNVQTLPTRLSLYISLPPGLSLAPGGLTLGASPVSLGINEVLTNLSPFPNVVRLLFPINTPLTYEAMMPGELLRMRLIKSPSATSPFTFSWVEGEAFTDLNGNGVCEPSSGEPFTDANNNGFCDENTRLSPPAAQSILNLNNATLGAP